MSEEDLPDGWESLSLAEAVEADAPIIYGILQPGPEQTKGVLYVRPTEIKNDVIDVASVRRTTPEIAARYRRASLRAGDVILSIVGTIGKVAIVPAALEGGNITQSSARLRARGGCVHPEFLAAALRSPAAREAYDAARLGTGVPRLNIADVRAMKFPFPGLDEQRRIVAKLDALRARSRRAKDALDAVPALLDRLRQSILAAAFRGDLTADWREQNPDVEPAFELLERIRVERETRLAAGPRRVRELLAAPGAGDHDASWFDDPEARGWALVTLEHVCDPLRGIPYGIVQTGEPEDGGVPTVRCGDIKAFTIDHSALKRVSPKVEREYARTRLLGGEVLLAIRGTVGQTAVAGPDLRDANISREVAMVPVVPGIDARFVMFLLASPAGQAMLGQHVKGVAQAGINLADLRALRVPIPPKEEQLQVVRRIEHALSGLQGIRESSDNAASEVSDLDAAILAAAFRGELLDRQSDGAPSVHEAPP